MRALRGQRGKQHGTPNSDRPCANLKLRRCPWGSGSGCQGIWRAHPNFGRRRDTALAIVPGNDRMIGSWEDHDRDVVLGARTRERSPPMIVSSLREGKNMAFGLGQVVRKVEPCPWGSSRRACVRWTLAVAVRPRVIG